MNRNYAIILAAVAIYYLLKWLFDKRDESCGVMPNKALYASVLLGFTSIWLIGIYVPTIPGHYLERGSDYERMLFVNMSPDDQDVESYRVPVMIHRIDSMIMSDCRIRSI